MSANKWLFGLYETNATYTLLIYNRYVIHNFPGVSIDRSAIFNKLYRRRRKKTAGNSFNGYFFSISQILKSL